MKNNKEISDELFVQYVNNELTTEEMKEVEAALIANGESEAVFHAAVGNYYAMKELADELLGKDEDETENASVPETVRRDFALTVDMNRLPLAAKKK